MIVILWCCVIGYGITLKVSKFKYKIPATVLRAALWFSVFVCKNFKLPLFSQWLSNDLKKMKNVGKIKKTC